MATRNDDVLSNPPAATFRYDNSLSVTLTEEEGRGEEKGGSIKSKSKMNGNCP